MDDFNRSDVKKECPSFYKEQVKHPEQQTVLSRILESLRAMFKKN